MMEIKIRYTGIRLLSKSRYKASFQKVYIEFAKNLTIEIAGLRLCESESGFRVLSFPRGADPEHYFQLSESIEKALHDYLWGIYDRKTGQFQEEIYS